MAENAQKRIRIGDLLIDREIITQQQLDNALKEQRNSGQKLGRTLIDLGYITEKDILDALSAQMKIPYVDLEQFKFNPELVKRLPETYARRYRAIVLDSTGSRKDDPILVGMADPTDIYAYDAIVNS